MGSDWGLGRRASWAVHGSVHGMSMGGWLLGVGDVLWGWNKSKAVGPLSMNFYIDGTMPQASRVTPVGFVYIEKTSLPMYNRMSA